MTLSLRAERVSRPAREKKQLLTDARQIMRQHLDGQPGGVGGETA